MTFTANTNKWGVVAVAMSAILISGCSDDDEPTVVIDPEPTPVVMQSYDITVTNLTANQPLSPVFVAAHSEEHQLWMAGEMASVALEKLAEGGDTADFASLEVLSATVNGMGVIMPGMSETLTLTLAENDVANVSLATMLVNTNDAFAGVNSYDLTMLASGDSTMMTSMVYDAGTEANSEEKGTMPGPADGGEGYNAERMDVDFIHVHPGVISMYDGLENSVLNASHRFDNPAVKIAITRTQ